MHLLKSLYIFFALIGLALMNMQGALLAQEPEDIPAGEIIRSPYSPDTILFVAPQNGPLKNIGRSATQGARLAFQILGAGLHLQVIDETARPEARKEFDDKRLAVVIGYFTESRFEDDAPNYLYLKKPALLPFLTTTEASSRGPSTFFHLMPTAKEQGEFAAMEVLKMNKRPRRLLVIKGEGNYHQQFISSFTGTLSSPPAPKPENETGGKQKKKKKEVPLKPLDSKALVTIISLEQALQPDGLEDFEKNKPDLIMLSSSIDEGLSLAQVLADSKFSQIQIWGGTMVSFRDVGAAFTALDLKLKVITPVINLTDEKNNDGREFIQRYKEEYKTNPNWISALAFDAVSIAVKGISSGQSDETLLSFLSGQPHYALGAYELKPGLGECSLPMELMTVSEETLGYLP